MFCKTATLSTHCTLQLIIIHHTRIQQTLQRKTTGMSVVLSYIFVNLGTFYEPKEVRSVVPGTPTPLPSPGNSGRTELHGAEDERGGGVKSVQSTGTITPTV